MSEVTILPKDRKLGRLPVRSDTRALMFSAFGAPAVLPVRTSFWPHRAGFPLRTFGNTSYGDCTFAKQAMGSLRMERIETKHTASITDEEIIRVYTALSNRLYGGGDNGAFETDALSNWRKPDYTFRDTAGRKLTIDAFTRINPFDHEELKNALFTAGSHGIAVCLNLPLAFQGIVPPMDWDLPLNVQPIAEWLPGSWGGHSMWARDYDEIGIWLVHTWGFPDQRLTWRAAAVYLDEAHLVVDSIDYWRTHRPGIEKFIDLKGIRTAVNKVSSQKIA